MLIMLQNNSISLLNYIYFPDVDVYIYIYIYLEQILFIEMIH